MTKRFAASLFSLAFTCAALGQAPSAGDPPLMPWPANFSRIAGSVPIDDSFSVSLSGAGSTDDRVKASVDRIFPRLARQTGIPLLPHIFLPGKTATLNIVVESKDHRAPQRLGDNERYSLEVANGSIRIAADQPLGALRGIETFLELVQQNIAPAPPGFSVAAVTIHDEPRFPWRGLSFDVSRHFIPLSGVERTIDGLSAVKLNVLHFHLSDDQGFRIESKRYPRLHQYGSDGLYYTQAEIRELLAYARNRGVRIVPEFDMPGHSTSLLPGYPNLGTRPGPYEIVRGSGILSPVMDPTKESTYKFLDGFVGEMAKLFPDEYFHIGGDEVDPKEWNSSPQIQAFMRKHHIADAKALQTYFNQRLFKIVTKHGKHMEGWDEVFQPDLPKSVLIQSWRGQKSLWQAAREGYSGILSAGYYLDLFFPASYHYAVDPLKVPLPSPTHEDEDAPNPNDRQAGAPADLTPEQTKLVLGGEAAMWEELATTENVDSRLWPRLAAIAERFWSPESITDTKNMYERLTATNRWLQWLGLTQRSNLELMRQRLAGTMPYQPLDTFAEVLSPAMGYKRHSTEKYSMATPFNRLIDTVSPESYPAQRFHVLVDDYLSSKNPALGDKLREELTLWSDAAADVRPIFQQKSLLTENIPVADELTALCRAGLDALNYLGGNGTPPAGWKDNTRAAILEYQKKPAVNLTMPLAPAVLKLIDAVQ